VTLLSSVSDTAWNLTSTTAGNQVSDYIVLSDSAAAGSSVWIAGSHSTNSGRNTGWSFSDIPAQLHFSSEPAYTNYDAVMAPVVVHIRDASGNLVTNVTNQVTLAISNNPNVGTLSGTTAKAAIGGVATFSDLSINKSGNSYTLLASASGLTGDTSNSFDITNPNQSGSGSGGGSGGGGSSSLAPSPVPVPSPTPATPLTDNSVILATIDALIKQVLELQAEVARSGGGTPGVILSEVSRPLTVGGRGNDVQSLQNFLISRSVGSAAQKLQAVGATAYFGSLTRAALAEFQKSVGIYPPLGYFGPITKAYLKTIGY
ncbi:MAG: peptidoglycan-binding domain-containing protein, partial [Patescibacteria group bacterium]